MSSRVGYEYRHRFSMVNETEIDSKYKLKLRDKQKAFLYEFRINFILKRRPEEGVVDAIIDSEAFDALIYEQGDEKKDVVFLCLMTDYRLKEYWMTKDEINLLVNEAVAFAKQVAVNPKHASLNLIPVVVRLEVCTVQQEGELFDAAMDRAIRAENLVPLYLWPYPTAVAPKPTTALHKSFLKNLCRIRVENNDEGLALMQSCHICSRNTNVGAQISLLPCHHAVHSHCIVRWLENNHRCPSCRSPAYDADIRCWSTF